MAIAHAPVTTRTVRYYIVAAVAVTVLAILGQSWWAIEQDRRLTLQSEFSNGVTAVRLLEEHAKLTLSGADQSLKTFVSAIHALPTAEDVTDAQIRNVLTRAQPFNNTLKSLQFVNPQGVASVSSIDYPAYQTDADDRTYIAPMLKDPGLDTIVMGQPFKRFYDGELVVPFARNIRTASGRYLGIISTDISVSYFGGVYARVADESKAVVSLFMDSGMVIVRSPFEQSYVGQDISKSPVFQKLRAAQNGGAAGVEMEASFEDDHFLDDKSVAPRMYVYRKIKGYPVTTVFARDMDAMLAPWRQRTRDRVLFTGLTIGFVGLLTFLLLLHMARLERSQASLKASDKSLRASESKFAGLFNYSPLPLAQIRLDNDHIVEINDSWSRQMGYQRDEVLYKTPLELGLWAKPADRPGYLVKLRQDKEINQMEIKFRHRDGRVLDCLLSSRVVDIDGVETAIFSPIDVTHQREIEQEIRKLNAELEDRVNQRTQKLESANRELEQALSSLKSMQSELLRAEKMAALGSLVAGVAHELNTPLGIGVTIASTLQHNAESLLSEVKGERPRRSVLEELADSGAKAAGVLLHTLMRAADLINSFKQVAVDQSSDNRRRFDLKRCLQDVLATLEPTYQKTRFTMALDIAPGIEMDSYPGALGQIVSNLVGNAMTHAFEGRERGAMQLKTQALGEAHVQLTFCDDGVGILPQHKERVFDPFFTTKLGRGGSGLGMNIVYNLVADLLGGRVELRSEVGQGTTIVITLPIDAPHHRGDGQYRVPTSA